MIIWKIYNSTLKEDYSYLNMRIDKNILRSPFWSITWASWSWKTSLLNSLIFWDIKESINELQKIFTSNIDEEIKMEYLQYFCCLDPHFSFIPWLKELIRGYLKNHPKKSIYLNISEYSKNIKKWNNNWWNNKNVSYDWFIYHKKLVFNPLICKDLINSLDLLEKITQMVFWAIKMAFPDFSSIWPRNTQAIEWVIKWFLLFNRQSLINKAWKVYTMKDLYILFYDLQTSKKLSDCIIESIKALYSSNDEKISIEEINDISGHFTYLKQTIIWNQTFFETSLTKLKDFNWSLWNNFWYWERIEDYTFDLYEMMTMKWRDVIVSLFNLKDFAFNERKIITSFIMSAWYVYWFLKDIWNKDIPTHKFIIDEFQSILELKGAKNYMIESIEKKFNEERKASNFYLCIFQYIWKELKDLLNNMWYSFYFSIANEQAKLFIEDINNWISNDDIITTKDIASLGVWCFYLTLNTTKSWLISTYWESFDLSKEENIKILFS